VNILHILPSVNPAGGGPVEGVRQRGLRLREMGHSVEVVSLDDPANPFLASYGLPTHALGPVKNFYGYSPRLVPWLKRNGGNYDAVVVNGLWQYHSFGAWRALHGRVPYFVFTHGMLDPWFKHSYPLKHLKKWLYWPWSDYRLLRDAEAVLFTSEEERRLSRESFWLYSAREEVVAYGTKTADQRDSERLREHFLNAHSALRGKRLVLFLSRIHVKKGCDQLIEAFARVAMRDPDLHLVIAGPDQTGWVSHLKAQAGRLGVADRISWPGLLQGDMKWGAFYASEVFVLPSHQENFGIAVAEALGCGLPVLISDKVNIWREVEADAAGFVAPDTMNGTCELLTRWLALTPAQRLAMRLHARASFDRRFTIDAMAHGLLDVIRRHQAGGNPARIDSRAKA